MKLLIAATLTTSALAALSNMEGIITNLAKSFCPENDPECELRTFNTGGSAALANSISKLDEYGCWCYFDDNHGRGKASPIDVVDEMCKILHDGYECAMRDAEDEGTTCIPWEVQYDAALGGNDEDDMFVQCTAANSGNNCAIRACTIEGTFVANLLDVFVSGGQINPANQHENGFDPAVECITKKNGGGPTNKECCGQYPSRFPFKTQGGDRKCCGNRTYNSLTLKCCDSGSSTVKFNC